MSARGFTVVTHQLLNRDKPRFCSDFDRDFPRDRDKPRFSPYTEGGPLPKPLRDKPRFWPLLYLEKPFSCSRRTAHSWKVNPSSGINLVLALPRGSVRTALDRQQIGFPDRLRRGEPRFRQPSNPHNRDKPRFPWTSRRGKPRYRDASS